MGEYKMSENGNNLYTSPEQMAEVLGLTKQEAELVFSNWSDSAPPSNPEERRRLAIEASQLEHAHRGDSFDKAIQETLELRQQLYGKGSEDEFRK